MNPRALRGAGKGLEHSRAWICLLTPGVLVCAPKSTSPVPRVGPEGPEVKVRGSHG